MYRRFRQKTKLRTGLRLRTLLYAGTICLSLLLAFSFFMVQFFRDETSHAAENPMIISGFEITQDTTPLFRGTSMQVMLRINIQTKGVNHKLNLNAIELAARGTSDPAYRMIENARLWSTGNTVHFSGSKQLGTTMKTIPRGNYSIVVTHTLQNGNNYFWLTYDILPDSVRGNFAADAECISIKIGTLVYEPPIAAPPGARTILNNIPYFSTGNGDISSLKSWNTFRDGSGKSLTNFSQSPATFHIQAGHIMLNKLSACLPTLIIEKNGVMKSDSDINVNLLEIEPGGTLIQEKILLNPESVKIFKIRDNGNFIHANTGKLPGARKIFDSNSVVVLSDYSNITFTDQIDWGNLVVDAKSAPTVDLGLSFENIRGNLEIRNTGDVEYLYSSKSDTIHVHGSLIMNGGKLILGASGHTSCIVVDKSVSIKAGLFSDQFPSKRGSGKLLLELGNSFAMTGGVFQMTQPGSLINITAPQIKWFQQPHAIAILPDMVINEGSELQVHGNHFGEIQAGKELQVKQNGTLSLQSAVIFGDGTFILDDGASLSTAHAEGINSNGEKGCIQIDKKYFHSNANYIFTGSSSPQYSGIFITQPEIETVHNLIISKASIANVVVLNQNFNIEGNLIRSKGNINKNSHQLVYNKSNDNVALRTSLRQEKSF